MCFRGGTVGKGCVPRYMAFPTSLSYSYSQSPGFPRTVCRLTTHSFIHDPFIHSLAHSFSHSTPRTEVPGCDWHSGFRRGKRRFCLAGDNRATNTPQWEPRSRLGSVEGDGLTEEVTSESGVERRAGFLRVLDVDAALGSPVCLSRTRLPAGPDSGARGWQTSFVTLPGKRPPLPGEILPL